MRPLLAVCFLIPALAGAGERDYYYQCTGADGSVSYSISRCAKGERQLRLEDDSLPGDGAASAPAPGGMLRLTRGRGGHFYATIHVNGVAIRAVVDTGASVIALSPSAATRIGLDLRHAERATSQTANGTITTLATTLKSVELHGNRYRDIAGHVLPKELGSDSEALLGMSFLRHFEINTDGYTMSLRPK